MPKSTKEKGTNPPRKNAALTTRDLAAILHLIQPPMKLGLSNPALALASLRARKPARTADKQEIQLTHKAHRFPNRCSGVLAMDFPGTGSRGSFARLRLHAVYVRIPRDGSFAPKA